MDDDDFWKIAFVRRIEAKQLANDVEDYEQLTRSKTENRFTTIVHGSCRKCGSKNVIVYNKQLRSADEGMTEIRVCQECGDETRRNA